MMFPVGCSGITTTNAERRKHGKGRSRKVPFLFSRVKIFKKGNKLCYI